MAIIVFGPGGCGKTHNKERLRAHFRARHIVDGWVPEDRRSIGDMTLVLTTLTPEQAPSLRRHWWVRFEDAMTRIREIAEMVKQLSPTQRACLEAAATAPLRRNRHGWANIGFEGYPTSTVQALERRGLLKIDPLAACAGEARITGAGRQALAEGTRG